MYESILEGTGLTKNESIIYLTLLKIGKSKSGEITRASKVSSGKIYETLYKLAEKGLVKSISENGVMHFIANDPSSLLIYLKEKEDNIKKKEEELSKIIPQLKILKKMDNRTETASLIKGFRGITPVVYNALENAKNIRIMGVRSSKNIKFNNFWKNWHRKRVELKKDAKILFSDKNTEYWKFYKKMPHTTVRELLLLSPSAVMIIDNNCFLFSYEEELMCIHIVSESMTKSFQSFFDELWILAKKSKK